jgi:purine-cytosine permease-like protein
MTGFRFAKPSIRRLLWSVLAVAVSVCVIASVGLFIGALVNSLDDPNPTSTGDYIRLFARPADRR